MSELIVQSRAGDYAHCEGCMYNVYMAESGYTYSSKAASAKEPRCAHHDDAGPSHAADITDFPSQYGSSVHFRLLVVLATYTNETPETL